MLPQELLQLYHSSRGGGNAAPGAAPHGRAPAQAHPVAAPALAAPRGRVCDPAAPGQLGVFGFMSPTLPPSTRAPFTWGQEKI